METLTSAPGRRRTPVRWWNPPGTPEAAFAALYETYAAGLTRQAFLLCGGDARFAARAVERGFQRCWEEWPAVAADDDPPARVRAAVYGYALSPWHRLRPWGRPRPLLPALLALPPHRRGTVVLHDCAGVGLARTAAETEATEPAALARLLAARAALPAGMPPLPALAAAAPSRTRRPDAVRRAGERSTARRTCACLLLAAATLTAMTASVLSALH
ncbi:hypothetical protein GCM10009757_20310 [Streptomyces cheonanensis]|uniref:Uncharacterized protein n=1 Tax=Streptomyces cheonanensis TaxID=312720 RepID=A0ABN2V8K7_9ACTN